MKLSSILIAGNTSGSVTLSAPDVAGTTTLTLPSTTSATTYKIQVLSSNGTAIAINRSGRDDNNLGYDGRAVSSITVMEIKG